MCFAGCSGTTRVRKRDGGAACRAAAGWAEQTPENRLGPEGPFHIWTDNQARLSNPIFSELAWRQVWLRARPPRLSFQNCCGWPALRLRLAFAQNPSAPTPSSPAFPAIAPPPSTRVIPQWFHLSGRPARREASRTLPNCSRKLLQLTSRSRVRFPLLLAYFPCALHFPWPSRPIDTFRHKIIPASLPSSRP